MGKFKFTIITPCHNVERSMFENNLKHMRAQTIGYENIEWIIVLHNCTDECKSFMKELVGADENVLLKELDNKIYSPSSPRNHAMQFATSEYIGYLDADDNYRDDTIEKLLYYFDKTRAQILVFRREFTLENENVEKMSETVPWDKTREIVLFRKDEGMSHKIYDDGPVFVTSRAFQRSFLLENDLSFREDISCGEDILYNIQALNAADLVCYLPQLIGYNYFINSNSIVQQKKSDEQILSIAKAAVETIELALNTGYYANLLIYQLSGVPAICLLSPEVSMDVRIKVKELFAPYFSIVRPIPEGRFIKEQQFFLSELAKKVIMNPEMFDKENIKNSLRKDQYSIVQELLTRNKDTDFGKRYGFEDILVREGYQITVPVTNYETYRPYLDLQKNVGDVKIFTAEPIEWYMLDRKDNIFPISKKQADEYVTDFERSLVGEQVFLCDSEIKKRFVFHDGNQSNSMLGINIAGYLERYRRQGKDCPSAFTSPESILFGGETEDFFYLHVLFALANREVDQLVALSASAIAKLSFFLSRKWKKLCDDIENGTCEQLGMLTKQQQRIAGSYFKKDPERAQELREILSDKAAVGVAKKIWPGLIRVTAMTTGAEVVFADEFNRFVDEVPYSNGSFKTHEGIFGYPIEGTDRFTLNTETVFYEFIDVEQPQKRPLFLNQIEAGKRYQPLITTDIGLYRYRLDYVFEIYQIEGDTVEFTLATK